MSIFYYPENDESVCFLTSAAYNQVHFSLDFILEANAMNPDRTAPLFAI